MRPEDSINKHFRLIPAQLSALRRLGISTIRDLLYHFPARYEALGKETEINRLSKGAKVTLYGRISKLKAKKLWKSRRNATEGWFEDATGRIKLLWFNQPYIASYVPEDSFVKLTGVVGGSDKNPYIANPEFEIITARSVSSGMFALPRAPEIAPDTRRGKSGARDVLENTMSATPGTRNKVDGSVSGALFPVYPESRGITSKWFYHALERVFKERAHVQMSDPIPAKIRQKFHLPELASALVWMHTPEKRDHAEAARKRFAFEEIFVIQVARAQERAVNDEEPSFSIKNGQEYANTFLQSINFPPTRAQARAIADILRDFDPPHGDAHPMARLLEGDVGAGKTLVAAATAYAVVHARPPGRESGTLQVAYMAPTEILATQHFQSFIGYFRELPINIGLITGSGCMKFPSKSVRGKATDISRSQFLKWVANGEIAMIVGTHALIQKTVRFQHLAYAIVDEQHRFGTSQRRALAKKENIAPHFLSMTATPIPRTLALTMYGDLDISVLDELPPGRAMVTTRIIKPDERTLAYEAARNELREGHQAFVICPRIEEPDPAKVNALQAKSAKAEAKRLKKEVFPEYEIGLLHGSMKSQEKDDVMRRFASGEVQMLVATSVVEVGINVPNATVMLIEGAERFGLAQLHQLRGRIQRSSHPPHCFLLPETAGEIAMQRLCSLEKSNDGFKLAEADLEARGAGDLFGKRQWGISDIGMEALRNPRLIEAARSEALALVKEDPELLKYPALSERSESAMRELHVE
ncbi:MAG: recombinase protein [Parcubacteria group bacterium GW2011_GWA2_51_10]|nr:MAG: recombinase protein [Parcubacteria group bacterium GW2011_GWA2_51_10]